MARNPEDAALAAVTKAIQDHEKASEKLAAAKEKFDAAQEVERRAARTVTWTASHPDLPEGFNLTSFRDELLEPFEEEEPVKDDTDLTADDLEEQLDEGEPVEVIVPDDASSLDEDDPFGDVEPAPAPRSRRR